MKKQITCFCEEKFETDIPETVDLSGIEDAFGQIISGNFMNISCPACKKVLKPEFPQQLVDESKGVDLYFIPEMDRAAYFMDKLEYKIKKTKRVVIGYRELVEKIYAYSLGLDDRVIEVIKYLLLNKATENLVEDGDISVVFMGKKNGQYTFHIEGIKKDEVGVMNIKQEMYDKVAGEIEDTAREEPYNTFLTPPYVSINRIYLEK
ncbi:MAG: hypothetical protein JW969_15430 [Spirochaetales bacterium]|nr:hypothetical protein [Spirochaetales bacterium]